MQKSNREKTISWYAKKYPDLNEELVSTRVNSFFSSNEIDPEKLRYSEYKNEIAPVLEESLEMLNKSFGGRSRSNAIWKKSPPRRKRRNAIFVHPSKKLKLFKI